MALDWTRTHCSETGSGGQKGRTRTRCSEMGLRGSEGCGQVENQMVALPFSCTAFTPCIICPLEEPQRECLHPPQPVLPDYPGAPLARALVAWAEITPSAWYPKSAPLDLHPEAQSVGDSTGSCPHDTPGYVALGELCLT